MSIKTTEKERLKLIEFVKNKSYIPIDYCFQISLSKDGIVTWIEETDDIHFRSAPYDIKD